MNKFFVNLLTYMLLMMLVSALFLRLLVSVPNDNTRMSCYGVNTVRQIERAQNFNNPKIIFIGGSNCDCSLYSPIISEHFNMPVCNTGVHAGIGLETQIELYKEYIHQGDIVVIIPEYEQLISKLYLGSESTLDILTSVYPQGYKQFTVRKQLHMLQFVPKAFHSAMICKNAHPDEKSPYHYLSLNEFGDVEMFDERNYSDTNGWGSGKWENPKLQKGCVRLLKEFSDYCKSKDAFLLVFPPAYKATYFDSNEKCIGKVWNILKKESLPVCSSPKHYRMADTLYWDSEYHLVYEGVMLRTNRLIIDMDSALRVYDPIRL